MAQNKTNFPAVMAMHITHAHSLTKIRKGISTILRQNKPVGTDLVSLIFMENHGML